MCDVMIMQARCTMISDARAARRMHCYWEAFALYSRYTRDEVE